MTINIGAVSCGFSLENRLDKREKRSNGRLAEWLIATVLKTVDLKWPVGSNPTSSASYCFKRIHYLFGLGLIRPSLISMISYPDIYLRPINLWSLHQSEKTSEKLRDLPPNRGHTLGGHIPLSPQTSPQVAHRKSECELTGYSQGYEQDTHRVIHS